MPVSLPPISRRRFLQTAAAAGGGLLLGGGWIENVRAADTGHRLALLSDTHINADPAKVAGNVAPINLTDNLTKVIDQIMRTHAADTPILINGDCAHITGEPGDYQQLIKLLKPAREQGHAVYSLLGNHDQREHFYKAGTQAQPDTPPVEHKHVQLLQLPRANWLLLDSLDVTNRTPGELGKTQIDWVEKTLDARKDKPAFLMVHHSFDEKMAQDTNFGLRDAGPLFELLTGRKHVKAVFYGHSHDWRVTQRDDGLHLINLPPTAYIFAAARPNGWVDCELGEDHLALTLRCLDAQHPLHNEQHKLAYR